LRFETAFPVSRKDQRQFAEVSLERLAAIPITRVAFGIDNAFILAVAQVRRHFRLQCPLNHGLGQPLEYQVALKRVASLHTIFYRDTLVKAQKNQEKIEQLVGKSDNYSADVQKDMFNSLNDEIDKKQFSDTIKTLKKYVEGQREKNSDAFSEKFFAAFDNVIANLLKALPEEICTSGKEELDKKWP
jgi:hypothetical protein